jgi:hypothetical protein
LFRLAGKETLDAVADLVPAWRYKLKDVACVVRQAKRDKGGSKQEKEVLFVWFWGLIN